MKINSLVALVFLLLIAIGFPFLFSTKLIAGGDYTSPLPLVIHATANIWSWCDYAGLGFSCAAINLHAAPMWYFALLLNLLHVPLFLIERILWWIPFFVGGYISTLLFAKKLFPKNTFWFLTPFIYLFNTYILMVVGGGQIAGIALGYALIPLLFWSFIRLYEKLTVRRTVVVGLFLALLVVIDPRIAFIGYFGCALYAIFSFLWFRRFSMSEIRNHLLIILLPTGIATLSHAYWILPAMVVHQNPLVQLGPAYSTAGAASYFSFATLENAFGLLHPNWPENLFGKTSFMKPEFLLLPILAFSSVLFIGKKKVNENKEVFPVVFLLFLALLGIFLAKGAQDPLGGFYLWIFSHVPGFQLFRDPTKWYLFVSLSYALLIPYTLQKISEVVQAKTAFLKSVAPAIALFAFVIYFAWLIRPLFEHSLSGVFISPQETRDYTRFDSFLAARPEFYRTLWIPSAQRFGLYSENHPVISQTDILPKLKKVSDLEKYQSVIQEMAVKYVVVPDDSSGEIFLTDRKYDEKKYIQTIDEVKKISWLKQVASFGKIIVFENPGARNQFFSNSTDAVVSYTKKNPTEYTVRIKNGHKGDMIVFSNSYDQNWILRASGMTQQSKPFDKLFNCFILQKDGNQTVEIMYAPQRWVNIGLIISAIALSAFLVLLFRVR